MADQIGVHEATVYHWERGWTSPEGRYYPKIIDFLGYTPYDPGASFGQQLSYIRRCLGLTQEQLAEKINLDPGSLMRWEQGKSAADERSLEKIHLFLSRQARL